MSKEEPQGQDAWRTEEPSGERVVPRTWHDGLQQLASADSCFTWADVEDVKSTDERACSMSDLSCQLGKVPRSRILKENTIMVPNS